MNKYAKCRVAFQRAPLRLKDLFLALLDVCLLCAYRHFVCFSLFVSLVDHATSPSVPRVIFVRDARGTHGDKVRVRLHCQVRFEPAALLFTFCGWLTTWEKTTIP